MRIVIKTLGCKANRYESDRLFDILRKRYEVFESNEKADLLIVNTCTVTHVADRKSRQAIRSFKSANPSCKVVVFGCGANISPEDFEKMEEVDCVVQSVDEVVEFVRKFERKHKGLGRCEYEGNGTECGVRTRALVKIQDGCNNYCSYCIVPMARGPEVSYSSEKILEEVRKKEVAGFKEIVLTGINMGKWKENGKDLADLIEYLIENTRDVRFRLSSIVPQKFSEKFFKLFKADRLCPHVHMSLQSGCDRVLERMRRRYDTKFFLEICEKFRALVPDIGLTTDVIVGFPGETDKEFEESCEFVKKVGFLKIHVFPFSRRKNTPAYHMKGRVPDPIKKNRAKKLRRISDELGRKFKKEALGSVREVLVETVEKGVCNGFTPNYIPVQFSCTKSGDLVNKIAKVKLEAAGKDGVVEGILLQP